jgi:radical SAM protein with 4Fe4S-binding SPASM domain
VRNELEFKKDRIRDLVNLAKSYGANIRINSLRPTEKRHMKLVPSFEQYYEGFSLLMELCEPVDLTDPILSGITHNQFSKRCPCGRTSFRIHSITPDGKIPISPCVYLHDYKVGNLVHDDILELIKSRQFKSFRIRNKNPELVKGCAECDMFNLCGGGCAARAYLYAANTLGIKSLFERDPFCIKDATVNYRFPQNPSIQNNLNLVHKDYLCTWIGQPK